MRAGRDRISWRYSLDDQATVERNRGWTYGVLTPLERPSGHAVTSHDAWRRGGVRPRELRLS